MKTNLFVKKCVNRSLLLLLLLTLLVNKSFAQPFNAQILRVSQVVNGTDPAPAIQSMNVEFSYFNPPGGQPQFFNIYAQVPGNPNIAWVGVNIYLDVFPNQRVLSRDISLTSLGIPDNMRVLQVNLYFENSPNAKANPSTPPFFIPFTVPVDSNFMYDTFNDEHAGTGGNTPNLPANYLGPIQNSILRGCDVPNVDLDKKNHPAGNTYAGDRNACAPAAVANSLSWIQGTNPLIGTDGLTERQRLEWDPLESTCRHASLSIL